MFAYARITLLCYAVAIVYVVLSANHGLDAWRRPLGMDYLCFWSAGQLALQGHAALAYDSNIHAELQSAVVPGAPDQYFPFRNPPIFLLPLAVLALLPYAASLLTWLVATAAGFAVCMRRMVPRSGVVVLLLAWPGVFDNGMHGQNGFLSASLLGAGLLCLERRPWIAGALFAALTYKPQLALLVPIALLAGGHWRALFAMCATVLALGAASVLCFGAETWSAFLASISASRDALQGEHGAYYGKAGVFSAVRLIGGAVPLAWSAQLLVSAAVAAFVARQWRSRAALRMKGALLVAAIPLATPWLDIYDLVMLAIPVGVLADAGLRTGFLSWERTAFVAIALLPVASIAVAAASRVQIAPFVEIALLAGVARRMGTSSKAPTAA